MNIRFRDREDAGRQLGEALSRYAGRRDAFVLGLPRGGIPVAWHAARAIDAPLDVFVVRKLGLPSQPELAMGAVASGGIRMLNREVIQSMGVSEESIAAVQREEEEELRRRERLYRGDRPFPSLRDKTVIIVDDGLATGATMRVAVKALRRHDPAGVVAAAPVSSPAAFDALEKECDEVVALSVPQPMFAIGEWYMNFAQTSDAEVREILHRAAGPDAAGAEARA
jgi:putative phosphoribosyl transferase